MTERNSDRFTGVMKVLYTSNLKGQWKELRSPWDEKKGRM